MLKRLVFVGPGRVLVVEAGEAEVVAMAGGEHSFVREKGEGVGFDELADLLYAVAVADEFLRGVDVDSVVACVFERSAGDTDMHFGSTGFTEHLDDLQGGGSSDYRIVYKHYPLAFDYGLDRRKLHLDSFLAERLGRKNEGSAHIFTLDQSHFVRQSAGFSISLSGAEAGIGHSYDDVCICWGLMEEYPSGFLAIVVYVASFDVAVGTGEVDIFHGTHGMTLSFCIELAADAVMIEGDDLTWLDVTDVFCTEDIECAGLAGYHIAVSKSSYRQRMEAVFVTAGIYTAAGHDKEGEGAFEHIEGYLEGFDSRLVLVYALFLDEVGKDFCVG